MSIEKSDPRTRTGITGFRFLKPQCTELKEELEKKAKELSIAIDNGEDNRAERIQDQMQKIKDLINKRIEKARKKWQESKTLHTKTPKTSPF